MPLLAACHAELASRGAYSGASSLLRRDRDHSLPGRPRGCEQRPSGGGAKESTSPFAVATRGGDCRHRRRRGGGDHTPLRSLARRGAVWGRPTRLGPYRLPLIAALCRVPPHAQRNLTRPLAPAGLSQAEGRAAPLGLRNAWSRLSTSEATGEGEAPPVPALKRLRSLGRANRVRPRVRRRSWRAAECRSPARYAASCSDLTARPLARVTRA